VNKVKGRKQPERAAVSVADGLHSAAIHLLRRLRLRDHASGIGPAQLSALSVLVFGGPKSLGELAKAEDVRPPTMSRIVAALEHAGLLRRLATEDKRRLSLHPTPKGIKMMQEARRRRVEALALALASSSKRELQKLGELTELMRQISQNIQ